jgi:hypothetical protein
MDPQIIDHYNELPSGVNVIDKMNEELAEAQNRNDKYDTFIRVMKQNGLTDRPMIYPITITKEQIPDYFQLFDDIKEKIGIKLCKSKKEGDADEEYDLQGVFDKSDELVEILYSELNTFNSKLNVSRKWCEYRVETALNGFKSLLALQKYWWENMLADGFCDIIIEMIQDSIIEGESHDIEFFELCMVECDKCHQCKPSNDGEIINDKRWECCKCMYSDEDIDE